MQITLVLVAFVLLIAIWILHLNGFINTIFYYASTLTVMATGALIGYYIIKRKGSNDS